MNKTFLTLFTGSVLLSSALLTGCGGTVVSNDDTASKKPTNTLKVDRSTGDDETDWTWYVDIQAKHGASNFSMNVDFFQGIPSEVQHFQYFLDTDNQASTGFSYGEGSYEISGADYMIEDGDLYKSNSKSTWNWSYVGSFSKYTKTSKANKASNIQISSKDQFIASIIKAQQINISIEPFDKNWEGTYSTISTQKVSLEVADQPPVVQPPVVQPPVVQPPVVQPPVVQPPVVQPPVVQPPVVQPPVVQPPVVQPPVVQPDDSTMYEDFESGNLDKWTLSHIGGRPDRAPHMNIDAGFNGSQYSGAFLGSNVGSQNTYRLVMENDQQFFLEMDILIKNTGIMSHGIIGLRIDTDRGPRLIYWDSYRNEVHYNNLHNGTRPSITRYGNYAIIALGNPIEEAGNGGLKHFKVDINAELQKFEPGNHVNKIWYLDYGNSSRVDNIKLSSN